MARNFDFETFAEPATDDQIHRVAPSVFCETAHPSRSERFAVITTAQILQGLRGEGWGVFGAGQTHARDGNREYTKHMLRLRHLGGAAQALARDGSAPELVFVNAHNGTAAGRLMGGLKVFACLNGLIAAQEVCGDIKVPHRGDAMQQTIQGAFEVLDGLTRVVESRDAMRSITLTEPQQLALADAARTMVYADAAPVEARALNTPRRWEDRDPTLWATFNRVQENLIRGGVAGRASTGRRMTTRPVRAIDRNVDINRGLWALAENMRALVA